MLIMSDILEAEKIQRRAGDLPFYSEADFNIVRLKHCNY